jgi:DNA-binding winged helix-turn-helix (wHTH) protein
MKPLKINQSFYLNSWFVTPDQNKIKNKHKEFFIEPKLMEVLSFLCMNAPAIISVDKLIENCWPNQFVNDNPLHKCIAQLRKILGDTIKNPQYIKTITRRGYSIVAQIRGMDIDQSISQSVWHDKVPYLGLKAYDLQQQAIFFGRTRAIAEIKSLLNNTVQTDLPLVFIDGLNAVGKTSLINMAIIPYLEAQNKSIKYSYNDSLYFDMEHYDNDAYLLTLVKHLIKVNVLNEWLDIDKYILELNQSLIGLTKPELKCSVIDKNQKHSTSQKIIFIDHFESVLNQQKEDSEEHNLILLLVLRLLKTGNYFIIISTRSESISILNESIAFKQIKQDVFHYYLLPPDNFEIIEIVQKPVLVAGLRYEINESTFESLDKVIIDDAKNMGNILPILSHTLKDLCENHNEDQQLTFERYYKIGRLTGALTYKIENILQTLSANKKLLFSNNLHHLIQYTPDESKQYVAKRTSIQLFKGDEIIKLINNLIELGMLQSQNIDSQTYVSILHDSILHDCDFFKDWISSNHLKLSIIKEVKTLADQWLGSNQNREYLLHNNYLLEQANHLIKKDMVEFSHNQNQYLSLSNKSQSKKQRLKILSLIVLISLLIFSFVLLGINKQTNSDLIKTNNNAENLITFMIGDLKDKLRPIGKLELLQIVGNQIINYYDNRPESVQSNQSLLQYHKALNTIGEVEFNQGKFSYSENIFKQAIKKDINFFTGEASKVSALFNYSQSNYWLGYISYLQKNYKLTAQYWSNYLRFSEQLVIMQPENVSWMLEKSYALNNLGSLNYQQRDFETAEGFFNLSAQLKKEILNKYPSNLEYIAELADTISWQANIIDKRDKLQGANDLYKESLSLSERLVELDPENKIWQQKLALANYRVALNYYNLGELQESKLFLEKSLPIYIVLNDFDKTNQNWIKELINSYIMISRIYRQNLDFDNASLYLKRGMDMLELYSIDSRKLKSAQEQQIYLNTEIALISLQSGHSRSALEQLTKIRHDFSLSKRSNKTFIKAYINFILAHINTRNKQYDQANLLLTEALGILNNNISKNKNKQSIALYVAVEKALGVEFPRQDFVDYLKKIKFGNPDYKLLKKAISSL